MIATMENLNEVMDFGHVIEVHEDGTVTEPNVLHYPETVYQTPDSDGQCIDDEVHGLPNDWSMLSGYTRQDGYSGPVMHPSEYLGGRLAAHILSTPGLYVSVLVDGQGPDDSHGGKDLSIGWGVAFKAA